MDYPKLVAELRDDPLSRGYAQMTPQEIVDRNSIADRPDAGYATIPRSVVSTWATNGSSEHPTQMPRIVRLSLAATRSAPFNEISYAAMGAAIGALNIAKLDTAVLDLNNKTQVKSLALLVSSGIFSQSEADELYAMSAKPMISRWHELGIDGVGDGHVISARGMI